MEKDNWSKYEIHVLSELDRLSSLLISTAEKLDKLIVEIALLKQEMTSKTSIKIAIISGLFGAGLGIITLLSKFFVK